MDTRRCRVLSYELNSAEQLLFKRAEPKTGLQAVKATRA